MFGCCLLRVLSDPPIRYRRCCHVIAARQRALRRPWPARSLALSVLSDGGLTQCKGERRVSDVRRGAVSDAH
eukprot:613739-Hanusia_phi.AAC.1